jgi:hypothetical protein
MPASVPDALHLTIGTVAMQLSCMVPVTCPNRPVPLVMVERAAVLRVSRTPESW